MSHPIYIIGVGSIVNDAHLPAYAWAGYNVAGIFDNDTERATATATRFSIPHVFETLEQLVKAVPHEGVIDIAVPGSALAEVLSQVPSKSSVLVQKPMGEDYAAARSIIQLVKEKELLAAVNSQLRYAPFITAVRKLIEEDKLGDVLDIEININVYTPWQTWTFLYDAARVEILYHSIHYIDLVRSFFSNPVSIYAKTIQHPAMKELASVKSSIIMDYGSMKRATILTNHAHFFGEEEQQSYIKFEGTKGAARVDIGVLKNYPTGTTDRPRYTTREGDGFSKWVDVPLESTWFPHAFAGSMHQLMKAKDNYQQPDNSAADALQTMACVEAAYQSSEEGGVALISFKL